MKTIIAGSRNLTDKIKIGNILYKFNDWHISEVISGCARGVDEIGINWAKANGIPIKEFLPDWGKYGKSAGIIRNKEMAEYGHAIIIFWDGKSKGTKHMMDIARKELLLEYIVKL